ncbi:MAG: hypothetical protein ABI175_23410, partial [Polyangiales bacterium]
MPPPLARSGSPGAGGRFAVYAAAGALAGVVPLPIVPRRILRALRGALAHDVFARHGLALTHGAREILAEPNAPGTKGSLGRDAFKWLARRTIARFAPVAAFYAPVRGGYDTLAFGRLLERYLDNHRPTGSRARALRIETEEAIAIRSVIDRAAARAIELGLQDRAPEELAPPEDYRGSVQRTIDGAIISASKLPEIVGR